MRNRSLNTKLLLIIFAAFLLSCAGITLLTDYYYVKTINKSQRQLYSREVREIISQLENTYVELQDTLMVENYEYHFKNLILDSLQKKYYSQPGLESFPFIIDNNGIVILHPRLERGHQFKLLPDFLRQITAVQNGNFDYTYDGVKSWVIFRPFEKWSWIVCYTLPFHLKYADSRNFLKVLILITAATTVFILFLVGIAVTHFLRPITLLTSAATEMAQGNLDLAIENKRKDEIGILTQSFIDMRNSIKEKIDSLNERNADLQKEVTERLRAEEGLRKSERRYRTLFEKSTDAILVVERTTGRCLDANHAAVRLSGRPLSELWQSSVQDLVLLENNSDTNAITETVQAAELGKATFLRPDKVNRIASMTSFPLDDRDVIVIARDITDELVLEEHLRRVQKMEAIGTLAGGIAHDFNNILSAIQGYTELVLMDLPPEAPIRGKLEAIYSAGERARNLVGQVLAFSRMDAQVRVPINLEVLLEDALKLLRPAIPATIAIQKNIDTSCCISGDPSRIHQIILNLCTNAYQAMEKSGGIMEICLCSTQFEDKAAAPSQIPPGRYAKLTVSDTGVGILAENLGRIFDPYFSTKPKGKGTGLGLSVVHGIVESHGGAIQVESNVGKGTTFNVYLPLSQDPCIVDEDSEYQPVGGIERVLIVDDEIDILQIEEQILEKVGYTVTTCNDPVKALDLFARQPASFDLVITDMTMPNLTGDKLACELFKIRPDIPVILCTGFSELTSPETAAAMGIKGFLAKPVSTKALTKMIRQVIADK